MNRWIAFYEKLMYKSGSYLRFEDIVSLNLPKVNGLFARLGLECRQQDLGVVEEANGYNFGGVPLLERVWSRNRHKLVMEYFDYSDLTCEE